MKFFWRKTRTAGLDRPYRAASRGWIWAAVAFLLLLFLTIPGRAHADDGKVTIVILGDRTSRAQPGVYKAIVGKARGERPDLYITIGDQIEGGRDDEEKIQDQWDEYFRIVRRIRRRLFILPGNHDVWDKTSREIWTERIKRETSYSFDYNGIHFVMLDTGRWTKLDALPEEEIDWLEADLKAHRDAVLTFVFLHTPYWYYTLPAGKEDRLHEIFTANRVDGVFSGHLHRYGSAAYDGILYTLVGSSGGSMRDDVPIKGHFYGYVRLDTAGSDFTTKVVPLDGKEELPADFVTIGDLKFFDNIDDRYDRDDGYVVPGEFVSDIASSREKKELSITIENIREVGLPFEIGWNTEGTNWEITPGEKTIEISEGGIKDATFSARFADNPYPLPTFEVSYPYREGRSYDHKGVVKLTRMIEVSRIGAVTIDGRVDGGEWEGARSASTFTNPKGTASEIEETFFLFGRDKENLYVLASCRADTTRLVRNIVERDGAVWRDDSVEIFVSPDPKSELTKSAGEVYHISVNTVGTILDRRITKERGKRRKTDKSWDSGCEAGVYVSRGGPSGFFQVELKVPLSAFETDLPLAGDEWGINFGRISAKSCKRAEWQRHESFKRFLGRMVFTR